MSDNRLEIEPEPTPAETAAILAALRILRAAEPGIEAPAGASAWRDAARRSALRSSAPWEPIGWERAARINGR